MAAVAASAGSVEVEDPVMEHFAHSNFVHVDTRNWNGRVIYKFLYDQKETLPEDVELIRDLCRDLQGYVLTFPLQGLQLHEKKYLTINGMAVCVAEEIGAPSESPVQYIDKYFTETLLKEPVKCSEGHFLEKAAAELWIQRQGDVCPAGDHRIGRMVVDPEIRHRVGVYKEDWKNKKKDEEAIRKALLEQQQTKELVEAHERKLAILASGQITTDYGAAAAAAGKLVLKIGGKEIAFRSTLAFGRTSLAKLISKKAGQHIIPGVSAAVGAGLGIKRFQKGEITKGILEILSGGIACIPGIGLFISIGVDIILIAHDIYSDGWKSTTVNIEDLNELYQILGLESDPEPTKEQVDQAFRQLMLAVHSDGSIPADHDTHMKEDQLTTILTTIKEEIYHQRGW